jgi:hypothetical protein
MEKNEWVAGVKKNAEGGTISAPKGPKIFLGVFFQANFSFALPTKSATVQYIVSKRSANKSVNVANLAWRTDCSI